MTEDLLEKDIETPEDSPKDSPVQQDDLHAKTRFCKDCGDGPFTFYELGAHSRSCPEAIKRREREARAQEPDEPETEERQEELYKFGSNSNEVLRDILTKHPSIGEKRIKEVMDWAELYGGKLQPFQLPYILTSLGVKHAIANLVSQKYNLALQRAQQQFNPMAMGNMMAFGNMPGSQGGSFMPGMGMYPGNMGYDNQTYRMTPYGPMPVPTPKDRDEDKDLDRKYMTKEDFKEFIEEQNRKSETEKLRDEIKELRRYITEQGSRNRPDGGYSHGNYEEERVPIDDKGNIVHPNQATSVKYVRRPVDKGTQGVGADRYLMEKLEKIENRLQEEKYESLRNEIRELKQGNEESPELRRMEQKLEQYEKSIDGLKEELDQREKAQLYGMIDDLKNKLETIQTGEYSEDSMRIVAQTLNTLGSALESRRPLESFLPALFPEQGIRPPPRQEIVNAGQGNEEVVKTLRQHGLTTNIQRQ